MRSSIYSRYRLLSLLLACIILGVLLAVPSIAEPTHVAVKDVLARKEFQQYSRHPHALARQDAATNSTHAVLKDVLSRKEFQRYIAQPDVAGKNTHSAFARLMGKFGDALTRGLNKVWQPLRRAIRWLDRHFTPAKSKQSSGQSVSFFGNALHYFLLPLLLLACALLLGLIVYRWYFARQRRNRQHAEESGSSEPDSLGLPVLSAWERVLQTVEALWGEGKQREALRTLHGACLALLDRRGVLRYEKSRANGEVLRELRRQGQREAQQSLVPIFRAFDRSWYGFLPLSVEEFTAVKEHSRQFHAGVQEGRDA